MDWTPQEAAAFEERFRSWTPKKKPQRLKNGYATSSPAMVVPTDRGLRHIMAFIAIYGKGRATVQISRRQIQLSTGLSERTVRRS